MEYNIPVRKKTSVLIVCDDPICKIEVKGKEINETNFKTFDFKGNVYGRQILLLKFCVFSFFNIT